MMISDIIKTALALIVLVFLLGIFFSFLFKIGVLLLIGLGVLYLAKRLFYE